MGSPARITIAMQNIYPASFVIKVKEYTVAKGTHNPEVGYDDAVIGS